MNVACSVLGLSLFFAATTASSTVPSAPTAPTVPIGAETAESVDNSESDPIVMIPLTPAELAGDSPCLLWATTMAEMGQCAVDQASKAADRLAEAIAAYRHRLAGDQLGLFDSSQVSWERFRDDACRFQASGIEGGSAYDMVLSDCLRDLSELRYQAVVKLSSCEEGDLACPAHP
jgi:uncharacterized protein YecT (DUF1311 family)